MVWLRPALVALFGLLIAPVAGLVALPVLVLLDPVTRDTALALAEFALLLLADAETDPSSADEAAALFAFLYSAIIILGFLPLALVASIGGLARLHSWVFYAGATGGITAAMPWLVRSIFHLQGAAAASSQEMRFALVFFFIGIIIGSVYWFVSKSLGDAGRKVGS